VSRVYLLQTARRFPKLDATRCDCNGWRFACSGCRSRPNAGSCAWPGAACSTRFCVSACRYSLQLGNIKFPILLFTLVRRRFDIALPHETYGPWPRCSSAVSSNPGAGIILTKTGLCDTFAKGLFSTDPGTPRHHRTIRGLPDRSLKRPQLAPPQPWVIATLSA
jgi:hypothetical protein